MESVSKSFTATTNPCKLCAPLGASIVFKGVQNALCLLHGSQGCATYIRRYLISHYKEPVDIASSNFIESTAVFGGGDNLKKALSNVCSQYKPDLIGVATTCLSETIGDDVPMILKEFGRENALEDLPQIVPVSTPSYSGTHIDGFHESVLALVTTLARGGDQTLQTSLFPGFVSPADLRHLKEIMVDFDLPVVMLPDYSATLDGPLWTEYKKIPEGGTAYEDITTLGRSCASIEFGHALMNSQTAGALLETKFSVPCYSLGLPIGITLSDAFFDVLKKISGKKTPTKYQNERGRLIDAYADGHKYIFEKKAIVYGEEDFVMATASFLLEIGVIPVLCASGAKSAVMEKTINDMAAQYNHSLAVLDDADFSDILHAARELEPDFLIGNSKGYSIARELDIPLIRTGFPVHDRIGGGRLLHLGYRGSQRLFDCIVNTIIEHNQNKSHIGHAYI